MFHSLLCSRFRGPWLLSGRGQFEGFFSRACVRGAVAAGVCSEGLRSPRLRPCVGRNRFWGFETDSKDTFLPSRCDMWGLTRFGSCPSGGFTWPGSCPYVQFFFAFAYSLGLLVWSMVLQFLSMLVVSESWMLDVNEASSLEGQFKVKRQSSGKPICLKLSVQFSPQVIGRLAGAFIVAFSPYFVTIAAVASAAATSGALHCCFALVGTFLSLVDHLASVLPLSLEFAWTVLQATEEVRQQAAAALATTTPSPRTRCHTAFWVKASPRVDVGDTPDSAVKVPPPGSCLWLGNLDKVGKEGEREKERGKEKGEVPSQFALPVLRTLSGRTVVMTVADCSTCELLQRIEDATQIPQQNWYCHVNGSPLPQGRAPHGLHRDCTVVMCARLKGGAPTIPGEWFCQVCQRGGCWPARTHCFRCGCKKGEKTFRGPLRERQALGRAPPSQGTASCPTERRPAPQQGSRKPPNAKLSQQVVLEALRSMGLPLELRKLWLLLLHRRSLRNGCWLF